VSAPDRTPRIVLPADGDLVAAAQELGRRGWRVHRGFALPAEPWDVRALRVVVVGPVPDQAAAQAALLCALRGAGLVVALRRDAAWAPPFLADLARLGPDEPYRPEPDAGLSDEQRALLDLLAEGHSIAQAARRIFLSLRTANRRVAEARAVLGVATTREAVLAYKRMRRP
jgi:DNA-binding NarL/FixJ family response regulator